MIRLPVPGFADRPKLANRATVRALLSGTAAEAIGFLRRHAESESFLNLAKELEFDRKNVRHNVVAVIDLLRGELARRGAL